MASLQNLRSGALWQRFWSLSDRPTPGQWLLNLKMMIFLSILLSTESYKICSAVCLSQMVIWTRSKWSNLRNFILVVPTRSVGYTDCSVVSSNLHNKKLHSVFTELGFKRIESDHSVLSNFFFNISNVTILVQLVSCLVELLIILFNSASFTEWKELHIQGTVSQCSWITPIPCHNDMPWSCSFCCLFCSLQYQSWSTTLKYS